MLKEKIGDIKRGKLWMVFMENGIVEKQKYYNGVIEKLFCIWMWTLGVFRIETYAGDRTQTPE